MSIIFMPDQTRPPQTCNAQRVLMIGGLSLCIVGMILGDVFAVFILHPNLGNIGQTLYQAAQLIPLSDTEGIANHFMALAGYFENSGTKIDAHSHIIHFGYLAILLAIIQPYISYSPRIKSRLAWGYILSAAIMTPSIFAIHYLGMAYSPFAQIGWASVAADGFGGVLVFVIVAQLVGLWCYFRSMPTRPEAAKIQPPLAAARILQLGGIILLLSGFFIGAGIAAYAQFGGAISEVAILKNIVTHAAAGSELMNDDFAAFGQYQAIRAISIAAHAHINEMAILLLLLSLLQPFILYRERWTTRWAKIIVLGAITLPSAIFAELQLGLLAGAIADIAGLVVIIALMANLFGLVRFTAIEDSQQQQCSEEGLNRE